VCPIPPPAGAVWLPLGLGRFALVDEEDFERLSAEPWLFDTSVGYAYRQRCGEHGKSKVYLHHIVLDMTGRVDHKDGDGLNNRRLNLRAADATANAWNGRAHVDGASRFKGVHRSRGKWQAQICARGHRSHLGLFATEIEAARAYDTAARRLFGEFARPNFPGVGEGRATNGV
jgi:hypothetical protein